MEQWFSFGQLCVGIQDAPINGNLEHPHATHLLPFANLIDHIDKYRSNTKLSAFDFNQCQDVIDRIIGASEHFSSLTFVDHEETVVADAVNPYIAPSHGNPEFTMEPTDLADVTPEVTFGEQAVNLKFNPSGDPEVYKCKKYFASLIDQQHRLRETLDDSDVKHRATQAINALETAQMWAVKAITTPLPTVVIKVDPNDPTPVDTIEKLKADSDFKVVKGFVNNIKSSHEQYPETFLPSGLVDIDALLFNSTPLGFKEVVKSVDSHQSYGEVLPTGGQFFTYGDRKVGIDSLQYPDEIYYQLKPLAIHIDNLLTLKQDRQLTDKEADAFDKCIHSVVKFARQIKSKK